MQELYNRKSHCSYIPESNHVFHKDYYLRLSGNCLGGQLHRT